MSAVNAVALLAAAGGDYQISRSVRLRSSASANFDKGAVTTNTNLIWTYSTWIKRGSLGGTNKALFSAASAANSYDELFFHSSDVLYFQSITSSAVVFQLITTQVFRDPSAWYHIVLAIDTTQATASNRVKLYVNGLQVTSFSTASYPSQNYGMYTGWTSSTSNTIGRFAGSAIEYFDGYLAETNFVTGQALTPSSFGETDSITGVWKPKKYAGTYGTNGFYLNFSDNSSVPALGYSSAGGTHVSIVEGDGSSQSIQAGVGACRVSTISTANASYTSAVNEYLVVTPGAAIPVTSSLKIYFDINYAWANGRNLYINGTQVSSGNVTVATVSGMQEWTINFAGHGITSLSSITTPVNTGGRAVFYGISIDGNAVVATANDWTPNNISVTAGVTYDSMVDVPTMFADGGNGRGNYAVLNPLVTGGGTISQANLAWTGGAGSTFAHSGFGLSSGKWYCEMNVAAVGTSIGLAIYSASAIGTNNGTKSRGYLSSGVKFTNGTTSAYGASFTTNDTIGMAVDVDAGTVEFFKNNTSQGVAYSDIAADTWFVTVQGGGSPAAYLNFGQRPFTYTPPTGFKALNTQNLPDATIKKGNAYFDVTTYTGNASTNNIVNSGAMQPDLVWIKNRGGAFAHYLTDAVRGAYQVLYSNLTNAEYNGTSNSDSVSSFNSNGFTVLGGVNRDNYNQSSNSYVAWQWKESASAGFDIVTYTGDGTNSQNVSHSLGVVPAMIVYKMRSGANNWTVMHKALSNMTAAALLLNSTAASSNLTNSVNAPTSTTFGVSTSITTGSATAVAYLFAEVAGFSKFGSYTGNGSADGPFVYLGFRPRFVMIKRATDVAANWRMVDTARDGDNVVDSELYPNLSNAEAAFAALDITANGFKIRTSDASYNSNTSTYIFAAFAENPFKNSLAR